MKQITRTVGCFTADFRDGNIIIEQQFFPAGFLFMNAMNEYWNPEYEIAPRLIAFRQAIWNVKESLKLGFIDPTDGKNVCHDIQYMLNAVKKVKPFSFLNLAQEQERCNALCGTKSIKSINQYLQQKAEYTKHSKNYWEHWNRPDKTQMRVLSEGETLLDNYKCTIDFYDKLGEDISTAKTMTLAFLKDLDSLKKRDERHLITLSLQNIKRTYMRTTVSYVSAPKSSKNKTLITVRRMTFERFLDFLVADFYEGLHFGHYPKQCKICKRFFLRQDARNQQYCDGIDPSDTKKRPCRRVAADIGRKLREKGEDHPIKRLCATRLNTIRIHFAKGKISEEQANTAKRIAQDRRSRALRDYEYSQTRYKKEITQESIYQAAGITPK